MCRWHTIRRFRTLRSSRRGIPEGTSCRQSLRLQAEPARKLKNLAGIPIAYVTADQSGRAGSAAIVAFLKQAGCDAEDFQLRGKGILGNGHFMMLENNRKQVFEAIRGWIESKPGLAA
jgi:hypothetical protein